MTQQFLQRLLAALAILVIALGASFWLPMVLPTFDGTDFRYGILAGTLGFGLVWFLIRRRNPTS